MRYVYLHGFNSGSNSRSVKELSRILDTDVYCPEYDYSRSFQECIVSIEDQINLLFEKDLCIMGTSLGGFFALSLRHAAIRKVVAWNPVIYPAVQLTRFLGQNTRFSDGTDWILTRETVFSYARSADPRVWKNFYWDSRKDVAPFPPERRVFFGMRDDVLDSELGLTYWNGYAVTESVNSGHRIDDYAPFKDAIL